MSADPRADAELDAVRDLLRLRDDLPGGMRHVALRTPDLEVEVRWPLAPPSTAIAPTADPSIGSGPWNGSPNTDSGDQNEQDSAVEQEAARHLVRAPTVGIADLVSGPTGAPLKVGDPVDADQTVVTVRIMDLTVPVPATSSGRVTEVLVEPGEPVEHHQPLLVIAKIAER